MRFSLIPPNNRNEVYQRKDERTKIFNMFAYILSMKESSHDPSDLFRDVIAKMWGRISPMIIEIDLVQEGQSIYRLERPNALPEANIVWTHEDVLSFYDRYVTSL